MTVTASTFRRVAVEDPDGKWELACGELRRKPPMAMNHNRIAFEIAFTIRAQLDTERCEVRADAGYVSIGEHQSYIPDVMVVPISLSRKLEGRPKLEEYREPLPLVVEVWSPSTGREDQTEKLPAYKRRGDLEIWLVHPRERSITAYQREADGSYSESRYREGVVELQAIPGVAIDMDTLRW
jgi:Uma2 family endonuclease